jgi:N-acetylglucosaminyl-diphospho-decaprenol L-rhamnosyltransferase
MELSIVILNYRSKELTAHCVDTIRKSGKGDYEIMIVDNKSEDDSAEFLHNAFPEIRVIANKKNLGYGAGNNIGIKQAKGDYVLILNPDVEIEYSAIQKMLSYIKNYPDVGIVGPQLIYPNGQIQDSYRKFPKFFDLIVKRTKLHKFPLLKKRMTDYLMHDVNPHKTQEVDWLVGAALLIPRWVFKMVGYFDERYFLFLEDTDLCRRVHERGLKVVYFPEAKAIHNHKRLSEGKSWRVLFNKNLYTHISSASKYFWKWRNKVK